MRASFYRRNVTVLLLVFVAFFFLFLIFAYKRIGEHGEISQQPETVLQRFRGEQLRKPQVVIVLSQMRSGSSVVGEMFNRRSDVSYFYEPLYPFGMGSCNHVSNDRLEVLRKFATCDFDGLDRLYDKAFNISKRPDIAGCKEHKICFTAWEKMSLFLDRDADLCKKQACPEPIDLKALTKHCRHSMLVALKVIYLCKVEWLMPFVKNPKVDLKVVHLVRDPRATVKSRMTFHNLKGVNAARWQLLEVLEIFLRSRIARHVCDRMTNNVVFSEANSYSLAGKYMRIRHEDFATRPVETTQKVYDFVGINMNPSVKAWLLNATSSQNNVMLSSIDGQGTRRNAAHVASAWRKLLSREEVRAVQNQCEKPMGLLGYRLLRTTEQQLDLKAFSTF